MDSQEYCIYCGSEAATTVDHVPPRLLLSKPYPPQLLTVPSCLKCNQSFQKDDEYTRTVVSMDLRVAEVPAVRDKRPSLLRLLERPESQGFTRYLAGQIEKGTIYGPDGQTIDKLKRDQGRTDATGLHILRGLYFKETGTRLDPSAISVQITSKMGPGLDSPFFASFNAFYEKAEAKISGSVADAFTYRAVLRDRVSAWLFILYGKFSWFAVVGQVMKAT